MTIENIENHMAYTCKCGGVNFALLKSGAIECNKCSTPLQDVKWWAGGMGAQLARAIKAEAERDALKADLPVGELTDEQLPPVPSAYVNGVYMGYGKSDLRDYARAALAATSTAGEAALGRATALNEMSLAQIQVLRDVSDEYNAWIRFHSSGGDYDDFLKQYGAFQ